MRKKELLDKTLCLPFCSYYKPEKNEELACRGYAVVKRLILAGRVTGPFLRSGQTPELAKAEQLLQVMCTKCDFHDDDCDFIQDRTAPPCGGFALLAQLIAAGQLTVEDAG